MKKVIFLLVFLLLLPISIAQDDWFYNSQNILINVEVDSEAQIIPQTKDASISYILANLTHIPYETFNQKIISFDYFPDAEADETALLFRWDNPSNKIEFGYSAQIRTSNDITPIPDKIPFPIQNLPEDLEKYIAPQPNIDSDDEDIIQLASQLAAGEDDLYVVVHKIAAWTKNNIEYDLSTLTADVSQPASWVLENKQGVCDELTSLFIAQLRALGIPAKFISGIAYTNSDLFPEDWGSHGWAEVYFPGVGWVPYDVTYGEFGYVDPTHIKLKESIDSGEPSINYRWLAHDVEIQTQDLNIETTLDSFSGRVTKPVAIDVSLLKSTVGFDSYALVEVELENLRDYYVSSELYISRPKEVTLTEEFHKNVLLKPREKKEVFWILKVPNNLQSNYIYTYPITVTTLRNFTASTELVAKKNEFTYELDELEEIVNQRQEEDTKVYSRDVALDCSITKPVFYAYESSEIVCKIKNTGNTPIQNANLCFDDKCTRLDLGITQEKEISFTIENHEQGKRQFPITLSGSQISKAQYLDVNILDEPKVSMDQLSFPSQVRFNDAFTIEFLLKKDSASNPENLLLTLEQDNFRDAWQLERLEADRKFKINLKGTDLKPGVNQFKILATYQDQHGNGYESEETFSMELVDVTFFQSIYLAANGMLQRLGRLSTSQLLLVSTGAIAVFIFAVVFIFRRKS